MLNVFEIPKGYETKLKIVKALNLLIQESSIDRITVARICAQAGLARQTFYLHFNGKYDVVIWYDMMLSLDSVGQIGRTLTIREALLQLLPKVKEEDVFYKAAMRPRYDHDALFAFYIRSSYQLLAESITQYNKVSMTRQLRFELKFYSQMIAELYYQWVMGELGRELSVEEYAAYWDSCVPRNLYHAINDGVLSRRRQESRGGGGVTSDGGSYRSHICPSLRACEAGAAIHSCEKM